MFKLRGDRGLKQYLEEISRYSILTKEEEFALAKKIRSKKDIDAQDKLICANLRIVVYIAKKYLYENGYQVRVPDLISA